MLKIRRSRDRLIFNMGTISIFMLPRPPGRDFFLSFERPRIEWSATLKLNMATVCMEFQIKILNNVKPV